MARDRGQGSAGAPARAAARRRGRALQDARRALQGGNHRVDPLQRAHQPVRPGRLGGSVPRTARAQHRQAQGVQAHEGGGRLLARRFAQRDAAADLRHRLGQREAAEGVPDPPGGGGEARSPAHRQGTRSVPPAGGGAGRGVLASEGLDAVPAADRVHARAPARRRLPRGQHSGDHGPGAVDPVRSHRELRREHVHDQDAGRARRSRSSR